MERITIKDIKIGTTFCQPELVIPHNQMMTIIDIKYNRNAGKPVNDMWGNEVWPEPFATIEAIGSITGEKKGYAVQSEDSDLSDWLTFCTPKERIEAIYADRRKKVINTANRHLGEIVSAMQELRNYPTCLDKDEKMKNLIEYVAKAMIEVF